MARRISSPAFVGRSEQLGALSAALTRAGAGEASAVLIGGESGVGKSRLLAEFERLADPGEARFLAGTCVDVGGSELPYSPIVAALRPLGRETDNQALSELVGPGSAELAPLLPALPLPDTGAAPADPMAQSRLFEALLGLLERLARAEPVVLVVEDIHWADPSTRSLLAFLARNVRTERLLLVATYRTDELHRRHPLRQFLADVERIPAVERVELERFQRRELAAQLSGILDAPAEQRLVDELYERSQGNAFFAEELLAASNERAPGGLPETLRDALTLRLGGLSTGTRRMLRAAATAGTLVGDRLLAASVELPADELNDAVREAIEHNVLVQDPGGESYSFRHALLREALYDELVPGERGALHASLARALERDPSLAVGAHGAAAERASHWYAAHELARALAASVEAGGDAERVLAFTEANRNFERAAELWDRVPAQERPEGQSLLALVRRAGEAAHLSDEPERAVALARHALELVDANGEPAVAGSLHERLARYLVARGDSQDALAEYRAAAELLPDEPTAERASVLAGEAHILMLDGEPAAARAPCEEAIAIARKVGSPAVECSALITLGVILATLGAREQGCTLLEQGMRMAEELGSPNELARAYINLSEVVDEDGRVDEAAALALEGWERLRGRSGTVAPFLAGEAGARLDRLGRWDEAAAVLVEAADALPANIPGSQALAVLAELETRRGRLELAAAHLARAQPVVAGATDMWAATVRLARAVLAVADGRAEDVRSIFPVGDAPHAGYPFFLLPEYANALQAEAELAARARAGRDQAAEREALGRAEALLGDARALSAPETWPLGPPPTLLLLYAELCELEAARARAEPDVDRWARQAEACDEADWPFGAAYSHLREAEAALAAALPRARVAEALAAGRAIADRLGAQPLLREIDELARRTRVGRADTAPASDQVAGLTARELDVLRLLTEGLTNREIGQALFMSPKTASVHVSRILAKLGVKTRTEAAGIAHRLGVVGDSSTG